MTYVNLNASYCIQFNTKNVDLSISSIHQPSDLLGNQPDKEDDDRGTEQQQTHVGELMAHMEGICVVAETKQEKHGARRHKQFERGVERCNLEDDQQETNSVT